MSRFLSDTPRTLHLDAVSARARVRPWPPSPTDAGARVAHLVLFAHSGMPTDADIHAWLATIAGHGYTRVRTGAVHVDTAAALERSGFVALQRLALLQRPVTPSDRQRRTITRAGRPWQLDAAAIVDAQGFASPWQLDRLGLADVRLATPDHRFRTVTTRSRFGRRHIVGFAITGHDRPTPAMGQPTAYLQRLAVSPHHQRAGIGSALVVDAISWAAHQSCNRIMVNTHVENHAALALYEHHDFRRCDDDLIVMERSLA